MAEPRRTSQRCEEAETQEFTNIAQVKLAPFTQDFRQPTLL